MVILEERLCIIRKYYQEHKTTLIPIDFIYEDFRLGSWVSNQPTYRKRNKLSKSQISMLEIFPDWTWNRYDSKWNNFANMLDKFYEDNKTSSIEGKMDSKLKNWAIKQRDIYKNGDLTKEKIDRLEKIDRWSWDPINDLWNTQFNLLKEYVAENGSCKVPHSFICKGFNLSNWILRQRQLTKKKLLSLDRLKLLESLNGWSLDPFSDAWDNNFNLFSEYVRTNNSTRIPQKTKFKGAHLGQWVEKQRASYASKALSEDRIKKLESISGWIWKVK